MIIKNRVQPVRDPAISAALTGWAGYTSNQLVCVHSTIVESSARTFSQFFDRRTIECTRQRSQYKYGHQLPVWLRRIADMFKDLTEKFREGTSGSRPVEASQTEDRKVAGHLRNVFEVDEKNNNFGERRGSRELRKGSKIQRLELIRQSRQLFQNKNWFLHEISN